MHAVTASATQERSWAERARTLLAVTRTANLQTGCRLMAPHTSSVQVVADDDGNLTAWVPESSTAMAGLGACRVATVTVHDPDSVWSLRVVGSFRMEHADGSGRRAFRITPLSVRVIGSTETTVAVGEFLRATPDPLSKDAASVLHHLETSHADEIMASVRANGHDPVVVSPRSLDSRGIELSFLGSEGVGRIRVDFPDGPVRTVDDALSSLALDCTCWR